MARITPAEAQGWGERTKLNLGTLDADLLSHIEEEVLARINSVYDTSVWTTPTNTPRLIRVIISKMYVSWFYDRQYSENQDEGNDYAALLRTNAEMLITGILDGTIEIPDVGVTPSTAQVASFYPNDLSSAQVPTLEDPSLGPAKFSMGKVF
jgi:hypothetical protein